MPVQDALQTYRLKSAAMEAISTALRQESKKRKGRTPTQWREAELHAVYATAQYFAQQNDLRVPLLEEVLKVEKQALGHSDYSSKWSLYVAEIMIDFPT